MPHFDKHFTLNEANALLPRYREIFARIQELIDEARGESSNVINLHGAGRTNGSTNGTHSARDKALKIINELISEITDAGVVIQDVSRGLIDFPAMVDGNEIFLCYELADGEAIQFYHELESGYAGRRLIIGDEF
ncbi:MAG: DUF2203 domain-containing protein [Candidatus Hinthialibacter antarcticus]|nr:DUF2203 domain-containing protein [Candidatus Hinthialibacter antarcticus]